MIKPIIFKFEKGQMWDGDEEIFKYIEDLLLEETKAGDFPKVKQKTYITIMCVKFEEPKPNKGVENGK